MSLNRLALRLAAICALTNNGRDPHPTLAGPYVFDSRLDPIENIIGDDTPLPVLTVYTDRSNNLWPVQVNGENKRATANLFIEASVAVRAKNQAGEYEVCFPATDAEIETTLDVLGFQVKQTLFGSEVFAALVSELIQIEETRAATADGQRMAVNFLDMQFRVMPDKAYGRVPDHFRPLIALLKDNPEYADRVPILEQLCIDPSAVAPGEITRRAQFWPRETARALGYPV